MKKITSYVLALIMIFSLVSCVKVELTETTEQGSTAETETKETTMNEKETEEVETATKTAENTKEGLLPVNKLPAISCKIPNGINWLEKSIKNFEKEEVKEGVVMFYGSSMFTRWTGDPAYPHTHAKNYLKDDIRAKDGSEIAVNHGFGTSTWHELCYYYERAVRPWKPKALVLNEYGNTIGNGYTLDEIIVFINWICTQAKKDFPDIQIYIATAGPNAKKMSDGQIAARMKYNDLLNDYAKDKDYVHIIETYKWDFYYENKTDVGTYKNTKPEIFAEDLGHLSELGYKYYAEYFTKALEDVL